ncbi:hypothetical protein P7K49_014958 [Saguinus oedipus]|uniref:Uncharacterized protein n=1 Tax=Saguinus oedipus TaxID=9490 RepID=A0ABQ9V943_SAGOE|nr:hypothetical protein P7K49_014958 [Saguinus oedipus]
MVQQCEAFRVWLWLPAPTAGSHGRCCVSTHALRCWSLCAVRSHPSGRASGLPLGMAGEEWNRARKKRLNIIIVAEGAIDTQNKPITSEKIKEQTQAVARVATHALWIRMFRLLDVSCSENEDRALGSRPRLLFATVESWPLPLPYALP